MLDGYFNWDNQKLNFVFREKSGSFWTFSGFKPGKYLVQFTYENQYPAWEAMGNSIPINFQPIWNEQIYHQRSSETLKIKDVWTGEVSTAPIEFQLIP
ncbi:MAG: hypothetical protein VKL59_16095 [Nostocaceae cyanobacterium]|nr:hypothetical protein [Nostocaceae cyanobacterium]